MPSDGKISLFPAGQRDPDERAEEEEDDLPPLRQHGVRAQNRRQKLLFLLGTIVLTVLIVAVARYWLHSVRPLRIAAGPPGTVEYRFAEKFTEVASTASSLRLTIVRDDSPAAAAARFARGDADLGFVRTDQKVP